MTSFFKKHLLLILIVLFATGAHIYKLGSVPMTLNPDEASIAYNALLLKETGNDEWGKQWPLVLDAFGDQKLIGYPALVVLSFQVFGYSDWAVKVPSVIAGSVLILLVYTLQLQLGKKKNEALLTAGLVATLPVFFFYSRVAFEAMVALVYLLAGFSLLLSAQKMKLLKNKLISETCAALLFLVALLTYNSPIILLPLIIVSFIISQGVLKWRKWARVAVTAGVIWLCFFVYFLPLTQQKSKITLFGDETTLQQFGEYRAQFHGAASSLLGNKYLFYGQLMAQNYAKSWSPAFLLYNVGGHPWHTVVGFGYFSWTVYLFGLIGIGIALYQFVFGIFKNRKVNQFHVAILFLFLTSLLPSIITVNAPQATRSLLFFLLWSFFSASGIMQTATWVAKKSQNQRVQTIAFLLIGIALTIEVSQYGYFYFSKYGTSKALESMFEPGLESAVKKVEKTIPEPLAIVDERGFNYILVAWYLKMSPTQFYASVKKQLPDKINFKYGEQVGRYHFIGQVIDRKSTEKTVLEWDSAKNEWVTHQF